MPRAILRATIIGLSDKAPTRLKQADLAFPIRVQVYPDRFMPIVFDYSFRICEPAHAFIYRKNPSVKS